MWVKGVKILQHVKPWYVHTRIVHRTINKWSSLIITPLLCPFRLRVVHATRCPHSVQIGAHHRWGRVFLAQRDLDISWAKSSNRIYINSGCAQISDIVAKRLEDNGNEEGPMYHFNQVTRLQLKLCKQPSRGNGVPWCRHNDPRRGAQPFNAPPAPHMPCLCWNTNMLACRERFSSNFAFTSLS